MVVVVVEPVVEVVVSSGTVVRGVNVATAASERGSSFANLVMVGALAATLGEPDADAVADAAVDLLGRKADPERIRDAVLEGWRWAA